MINIVKEHTLSILKRGSRLDGRKHDEFREMKLEYGVSKSAEGSARVVVGDTEVIVGIKMEVMTPFLDTPDEGGIMVNAELRPLSNPKFELGPPGMQAIELARVVDRALREGCVFDFKKLCIKKGEAVWMVVVDIYPINDSGNLIDISSLAALAALQDAKFPELGDDNKVNYKEITNKKLQLKALPLCCTVLKIGESFIVDPSSEEEEFIDARLTVGMLEDGTLCSLQKGEDSALTIDDIDKMIDIALKKNKELRKVLAK